MKAAASPLPVLIYHGLHTGQDPRDRFDDRYSVTPERFAAQLDWLVANGWQTTRLDATHTSAVDCGRRIVLTFDDGDASHIDVVLPHLLARGMVAEFFPVTQGTGKTRLLSAGDLKALVVAGMGVQSHTHTHRSLDVLGMQELERELRVSKELLENITGAAVTALALPGGRGGARVIEMARRYGYEYVLDSTPGLNCNRSHKPVLNRLCVEREHQVRDLASMVTWHGSELLLLCHRGLQHLCR